MLLARVCETPPARPACCAAGGTLPLPADGGRDLVVAGGLFALLNGGYRLVSFFGGCCCTVVESSCLFERDRERFSPAEVVLAGWCVDVVSLRVFDSEVERLTDVGPVFGTSFTFAAAFCRLESDVERLKTAETGRLGREAVVVVAAELEVDTGGPITDFGRVEGLTGRRLGEPLRDVESVCDGWLRICSEAVGATVGLRRDRARWRLDMAVMLPAVVDIGWVDVRGTNAL